MERLRDCPSCRSKSVAFVFNAVDFYTRKSGQFSIWKCDFCGCHFLNPRPTANELIRYYPENYYSFQAVATGPRRLAARVLGNLRPFRLWNAVCERLNKGNAWARTLPRNVAGSLLDVGCGSGAFLMHLRELNPHLRLVGCDPFGSVDTAVLGKSRIEYHNRPLESCGFATGEFHTVTINHVLEHHACPGELLGEISRVLRPGGRLHIGVPNTDGIGRKLFGSCWAGWDAPRHLVDFGVRSMLVLLARKGFRLEAVRHLSNAADLLTSITYCVFGTRDPHHWWKSEETRQLLWAVLNPIAFATNQAHLGDNIEVTCTRP